MYAPPWECESLGLYDPGGGLFKAELKLAENRFDFAGDQTLAFEFLT
jgi:hypothetical protein